VSIYFNVINNEGILSTTPRIGTLLGATLFCDDLKITYHCPINNGEFCGEGYTLFVSTDSKLVAIWTMGAMAITEKVHEITRI
jgi:hypothetical protein